LALCPQTSVASVLQRAFSQHRGKEMDAVLPDIMLTRYPKRLYRSIQLLLLLLLLSASAQRHGGHKAIRGGHKARCGTWQQDYTRTHGEIMSSLNSSSRLFIYKSVNSGLADRLVGLLTGFWSAVLSRRAFVLTDWWTFRDVHVRLSDALENFHINLTLPDHLEQLIRTDNSSYTYFDYVNAEEPLLSIKRETNKTRGDVQTLFSNSIPLIVFESNRGNIYNLLKSRADHFPGMAPEDGVFCAFHYLFRPRPEVLEMTPRPILHTLHDESLVKIGLQIRLGDRGFSFETASSVEGNPYVGKFFDCAADIAGRVTTSYNDSRRVVTFLISDSLSLKQSAVQKYGGAGKNLFIDTTHKPMHVGISNDVNDLEKHGPLAMQTALLDVLAFSLCDFFVISHDSGIGKLGALLSPFTHQDRVFVTDENGCHGPVTDSQMASSNQGARRD